MSIRKRSWITPTGAAKTAWQVDYRDNEGKRRSKQFERKRDAEAWLTKAAYDVSRGVHTPDSQSVTVKAALDIWIAARKGQGLERSTIASYEAIARNHIVPIIGDEKLSRLTKPGIEAFKKSLTESGRTKHQTSRALSHLTMAITEAERQGYVAQNAARGVRVVHSNRDRYEVEIPDAAELRLMIEHSDNALRPLVMTAMLAALRASELRGLKWTEVDLKARTIKVVRRADEFNVLGAPKSKAGRRSVPISPRLIAELRAWKLRCPPTELDLVFPSPEGKIWSYTNLTNRAFGPMQVAAGVSVAKLVGGKPAIDENDVPVMRAKYGLHALRHGAASLWIKQGIDLMRLKTWMGHSSVQTTIDRYGHLMFDAVGDAELVAKAETALFG